jgi:uncharacterized protein (TIGR02594 family)
MLAAGSTALGACGLRSVSSYAQDYAFPFLDYWSAEGVRARRLRLGPFGQYPALEDDIRAAETIIAAAPKTSPVEILAYFADLSQVGSTGEPFNSRWRHFGNPVIVRFFSDTKTTPDGDCTSWCAACLSWCLERAGIRSMRSARSQDYLGFGNQVCLPTLGTIVVFQKKADYRFGHVGLYLNDRSADVYVLGGNQGAAGPPIPSCGASYPATRINREWREKDGAESRVAAYRAY